MNIGKTLCAPLRDVLPVCATSSLKWMRRQHRRHGKTIGTQTRAIRPPASS